MMEQEISIGPPQRGGGSEYAYECTCVCMYVVGGLSVSEAAVSPPRLSLITPLTPQEALDVRLAS